jgi:DNA-binding MarR family transcriptional regulator
MTSPSTIAVLHHIATTPAPTTIKDLINDTGYSEKQLHRAVNSLTTTGDITEKRGVNNRKELHPGNGQLMTAYNRLIANVDHVHWGDLFTPTLLRVAWNLDTPTKIRTIADRLNVTPQAVYSALDPLAGRAMLNPAGPEYALADNLSPLHAVADAAAWHTDRIRVDNLASPAVINWYDPIHCLVRPQTPDETTKFDDADNWHVTGVTAFIDYDLQFFTPHEPLVWYSDHGPPTPEEIACHALLSDPGPRHVSYAMLLIETLDLDHDAMKQHAARYDLEPVMNSMLTALTQDDWTSNGKLPGPREYEQLKHQYEVTNA